jgi:hypothetical protein
MDKIDELRERLVPYHNSGSKVFETLRLSGTEFKRLHDNISTGAWLDMQKAAMVLDDPEVVAVYGGIGIQVDPDGQRDQAVAFIATALTEKN